MSGFYEEIKSSFNKVIHACDIGDSALALNAAINVQQEIARQLFVVVQGRRPSEIETFADYRFVYDDLDMPDIAQPASTGDLEACLAAVDELDRRFAGVLGNHGVQLNIIFDNVVELQSFLKTFRPR